MHGVEYVERAIQRVKIKDNALDVGCGDGGQTEDKLWNTLNITMRKYF